MVNGSSGLVVETSERLLTASEFQNLANVPPEVEWFANIENANTRRAYKNDVREFMRFAGIHQAEEFRMVKRSHLIAWRKQLETRALQAATVRRKLSAVASLFEYLCDCNAVPFNPADGLKRPNQEANEGKPPACAATVSSHPCCMSGASHGMTPLKPATCGACSTRSPSR
jgi:hypothetical protein